MLMSMKPNKIVDIAMLMLSVLAAFYFMIRGIEDANINKLVIDRIFSFIFPTFIFFLFWFVSYKNQNQKTSIGKYYLKVALNVVLPYFICMIPYIIYKYGMNNLESDNFVRLLITGEVSKQFILIKSIISLLIAYPFVEWLIKLNKKVAIIIAFILSAISNLLHFDLYFLSDVLNYLIYMAIGISFAQYGKETVLFLRRSPRYYVWYVVEVGAFMFITTKFEMYRELGSVVTILYSILMIIMISYLCYRHKTFYNKTRVLVRDYLLDIIAFNPAVIIVSVFLLASIITTLVKVVIEEILINATLESAYYMALLMCVLMLFIIKAATISYYKKHKNVFYRRQE